MNDNLIKLIMRHLTLLDSSFKSSVFTLNYIDNRDLESVLDECENRDRIISLITKFQNTIESELNQLKPEQITPDLIEIAKAWNLDIQSWVSKTDRIDQTINKYLEEQKEEATKEIATVFKAKEKFKGYNLNNVKK